MEFKLDKVIAERKHKQIFRDGDKVIKVFDETYNSSDILNEALNLSRVSETDIKVPKFFEVCKIDGKWAIVTEYIEGKTMKELVYAQPEKIDEYMQQFVDLQIFIHSKKNALMNRLGTKMNRKICEADIDSTIRYELLTRLQSLPEQYSICHGDFSPSNIIITPKNELYVIDWSHVTQGNPCADVARTYLLLSLKSEAKYAEEYLDTFCKTSGMNRANVFAWLPIVACSQTVKKFPEEKELLLKWVNVVDYE